MDIVFVALTAEAIVVVPSEARVWDLIPDDLLQAAFAEQPAYELAPYVCRTVLPSPERN